MQVSIKWLNDYIKFNETAEELADKYTMSGVPVENVIRADEGLDKVVTGRIEKLEAHPDSDHLQICQMNVGEPELIQIITGAQNVAEGQVVPVAMVGAHLPNGLHIDTLNQNSPKGKSTDQTAPCQQISFFIHVLFVLSYNNRLLAA